MFHLIYFSPSAHTCNFYRISNKTQYFTNGYKKLSILHENKLQPIRLNSILSNECNEPTPPFDIEYSGSYRPFQSKKLQLVDQNQKYSHSIAVVIIFVPNKIIFQWHGFKP